MKLLLGLSLLLSSFASHADLFGIDDRRYIFPRGFMAKEGQAVSVGVLRTLWTDLEGEQVNLLEESPVGQEFNLITDSLEEMMCRSEKFSKDPTIPYACTGFLIAPDLLVTAGHCATNSGNEIFNETSGYCEVYTWYFDYQRISATNNNTENVNGDNIYKCEEIIYARNDGGDLGVDFALVRLKRSVPSSRHVLPIGKAEDINRSSRLNMIGHPMGTPQKLSPNGRIIEDHEGKTYLKTNLDAFAGNSGSPVMNIKNEVIGILVAGKPNVGTYSTSSGCERYNRCDNRGRNCVEIAPNSLQGYPHTYSKVQKIDQFKDIIDQAMED